MTKKTIMKPKKEAIKEAQQLSRQQFVIEKYQKIEAILFQNGLSVGEITQILQTLSQKMNSLTIGNKTNEK